MPLYEFLVNLIKKSFTKRLWHCDRILVLEQGKIVEDGTYGRTARKLP